MKSESAPFGAYLGNSVPHDESLGRGKRETWPRYQMFVIGVDVADAVHNVAGLMSDRALLGWKVSASVLLPADIRPFRILGARHVDIEVMTEEHEFSGAIAVAAQLITARAEVRQLVRSAACNGACEVLTWGAAVGPDPDLSVRTETHALSRAARAFKSHALRAVGDGPNPVARYETFREGIPTQVLADE